MQYVECLYSAQGEYICQKREVDQPIIEGFFGDAILTPAQKQTKSYETMKKACVLDNTEMNRNSCIEKLATLYNDKCKKVACSPLSKCGTKGRQDACPSGKLKQCSDAKFTQSMITNGTNYINKSTVIPGEIGMPNLC
jgi:hypothetical protein